MKLAHTLVAVLLFAPLAALHGTEPSTDLLGARGLPWPLTIQANASGNAVLPLTDDPEQAKDLRLELAWKGSRDFAAPDILVNGQKLEELKLDREKSSFTAVSAFRLEKGESPLTVASASAPLARLLRRGANEFVFTSPSAATLTALSVSITPNTNNPNQSSK
jgi:hypothetical protein